MVIGHFGSARRLNDVASQGEIHNSSAAPGIPAVSVDQSTRRYLMEKYYRRPYSFVVFSSEAKQNMPDLDREIRALRNGEDGINLRLLCKDFSAVAECTFDDSGYMLRVKEVISSTDYTHRS